ncbi:hypothetical protein L2E82_14420 [Cichorium intybus]|uniref:Uncharacterized protein n=1 Tax=Cichorium intybus TaxID=13427 RepID=A0ACB9F0J7_CICIN|nr:hypothetical protein L2E82_14420 [Cichorium intybus]
MAGGGIAGVDFTGEDGLDFRRTQFPEKTDSILKQYVLVLSYTEEHERWFTKIDCISEHDRIPQDLGDNELAVTCPFPGKGFNKEGMEG